MTKANLRKMNCYFREGLIDYHIVKGRFIILLCVQTYQSTNQIYITLIKLYCPIKNKHVYQERGYLLFNYFVAKMLSNRYVFNRVLNAERLECSLDVT